jgi:hypothetical protein
MAFLTFRLGYPHALVTGLILVLADAAAGAVSPISLDIQVKAAFLPKFAAYVNWPPNAIAQPEDPVFLCVIGQDPFGRILDEAAASQHVDLHPVIVRRLANTTDAEHCNIAFLGGSAKQSVVAMQDAVRGKPILTVTDAGLGTARGMVHFELKEGRVRFHIDDALAARSNLAISARLLNLAISVKPRTRAS